MTDPQVLDLILSDESLTALAKQGDDAALAKALAGKVGTVASHARLTSTAFCDLFGWTRGPAIVAKLRESMPEIVNVIDRDGLDSSHPDAASFWDAAATGGQITADEAAALLAYGRSPVPVTVADVARILAPVRPDGKLDPSLVKK